MSDKKFIKDIYLVQTFQNYFQIYVRILLALAILIVLLNYVVGRTGGFLSNMVNPFRKGLMIIIALTAVVFIPYILYVLIKENRKGWISFLIILVILPVLFVSTIFQFSMFFNFALLYPILLYVLYCYLLNSQITEWSTEYYGHQNRLEQKKLKEEEAERFKNEMML